MRVPCCCTEPSNKQACCDPAPFPQQLGRAEITSKQSASSGRTSYETRGITGASYVKIKSAQFSPAEVPKPEIQLPVQDSCPQNPLQGHSKYRKLSDLGIGGSSFVVLAEDIHTKQKLAIKCVDKASSSIKNVGKEVLHQRLCSMHPNIIKFHEVFLTQTHFCIVDEYAPAGDLVDLIEQSNTAEHRALPEEKCRWLFQQVIVAMDYCHQMGIANRDIKLENALLMDSSEQPMLKLCDFGYSKDELYASMCKTMCGSPEYVAPEVLLYSKYAGKTADVWSCGILLYCMLTGCFPFRRKEDEGLGAQALLQKTLPRVLKADYELPLGLSGECTDLLHKLLHVDQETRITVPEIMQHPWFLKNLPMKLAELNTQLLRLPLSLLSDNCRQSEEGIAQLAAQAAQDGKSCHSLKQT